MLEPGRTILLMIPDHKKFGKGILWTLVGQAELESADFVELLGCR